MVAGILLLLIAAAVLLLVRQRRRQLKARPPDAEERHLFNLRIGDIVQAEGRDWVVEDRLLYEQPDGFRWLEYRLQDGSEGRWLSVSEDDELEVSWLVSAPAERVRDLPEWAGERVPERLRWQGLEYRLREKGTARLSAAARHLDARVGRCLFADYSGPGAAVLSLEWWGGAEAEAAELSYGERIDPALLSLLPGDGRSVYRPSGAL